MNPRKPARANAQIIVNAIQDYKITTAFLFPIDWQKSCIIFRYLRYRDAVHQTNDACGCTITTELIQKLAKRLPNGKVIIPYGATEALI